MEYQVDRVRLRHPAPKRNDYNILILVRSYIEVRRKIVHCNDLQRTAQYGHKDVEDMYNSGAAAARRGAARYVPSVGVIPQEAEQVPLPRVQAYKVERVGVLDRGV